MTDGRTNPEDPRGFLRDPQGVLREAWEREEARLDALGERVWSGLSYDERLAVTRRLFGVLCDHLFEGGTYRQLIYDRLEFGPDAYVPLLGGLDISNALNDAHDKGNGRG